MIVTKTPLRVSLFGGGSDLPFYYNQKEGLCISTSIDQHITIALNECLTPHIKLMYSEIEIVDDPHKIRHNRVRETLLDHLISSNIEIASFANIPTKGTGLGSSSSFTVGLINAIRSSRPMIGTSPYDLAEAACRIEIDRCQEPIGKQDQYAAAYGGFNAYEFTKDGVVLRPVHIKPENKAVLNERLLFFSTGTTRDASSILRKQTDNQNIDLTSQMVDIARQALCDLERGRLDNVGDLLHESWLLKQQQAEGITNDWINEMYETGLKAGALGGKLLGAGGGGFMMFYINKNYNEVRRAMRKLKCQEWYFRMTDQGSTATKIS